MKNVRIVLLQTYHPGNIGAAARAMMNMGIRDLVLVRPRRFPDEAATSRAGTANVILEQARVAPDLHSAIADCGWVIGTSARGREFSLPQGTPKEYAPRIISEAQNHPVAIVFGRERMGLSNEDIMQCHAHMMIPSHPDHPVLNIAQAIQVICYEIYQSELDQNTHPNRIEAYPNHETLERFYRELENSLLESGFINAEHPGRTMDRLRTLFKRGRPTQKELQTLFGALKSLTQDRQ
ncbi:MAG: RNA methyltransferase [Natronospirillum sp.]